VDLAAAEIKQFGRLNDAQALIPDLLDDFEAMQFFLRHGDQTGHDDSVRSWSRPGWTSSSLLPTLTLTSASKSETVASLTGPTVALLNSRYILVATKLKCPTLCKVGMSFLSLRSTVISRRPDRLGGVARAGRGRVIGMLPLQL
jgi:hypothetical protein